MSVEWKNVTSYSRGEKDRTPRVWDARIGQFRLSVHRHIYFKPDVWLCSCHGICDCQPLESKDIDQAKVEALQMFRAILAKAIEATHE